MNATTTALYVIETRYGRQVEVCALCGDAMMSFGRRMSETVEEAFAGHHRRVHPRPVAGDYLSQRYVTDTRVYRVVKATAAGTLTLEHTTDNGLAENDNSSGNPLPVTYTYVDGESDSSATLTVRLRKDGTYRVHGGNALTPAATRNGRPVRVTDYRY